MIVKNLQLLRREKFQDYKSQGRMPRRNPLLVARAFVVNAGKEFPQQGHGCGGQGVRMGSGVLYGRSTGKETTAAMKKGHLFVIIVF